MGTEESEPTPSVAPEPIPSTEPEPPLPVTPDETPSMMPEPTQSATAALPIPKKNVVLNEHGATAKIRNPWLVALFSLITIGIYHLFWYYFVNREMADYGEANKIDIGHSPGMSVVAITIGASSSSRRSCRSSTRARACGSPGESRGDLAGAQASSSYCQSSRS